MPSARGEVLFSLQLWKGFRANGNNMKRVGGGKTSLLRCFRTFLLRHVREERRGVFYHVVFSLASKPLSYPMMSKGGGGGA